VSRRAPAAWASIGRCEADKVARRISNRVTRFQHPGAFIYGTTIVSPDLRR
jgi:hypothetical protein